MHFDIEKLKANEKLHPIAINLGLKVDWADRNLFANSPEDYGEMFTWCGDHESEEVQNRLNDDIVFKDMVQFVLGGNWRTPTKEDFEELFDKCNFEFIQNKGVPGVKLSPKDKDNFGEVSLFLPAKGSVEAIVSNCKNGKKVYGRDILQNKIEGHYWISPNDSNASSILCFTDEPSFQEIPWHRFCTIRPVNIKEEITYEAI